MKWIRSEDKLPPLSDALNIRKVLVTFHGYITFGWHIGDDWKIDGSNTSWDNSEVLFWMPLPKLPKELNYETRK